jgi:hypothetical protein
MKAARHVHDNSVMIGPISLFLWGVEVFHEHGVKTVTGQGRRKTEQKNAPSRTLSTSGSDVSRAPKNILRKLLLLPGNPAPSPQLLDSLTLSRPGKSSGELGSVMILDPMFGNSLWSGLSDRIRNIT